MAGSLEHCIQRITNLTSYLYASESGNDLWLSMKFVRLQQAQGPPVMNGILKVRHGNLSLLPYESRRPNLFLTFKGVGGFGFLLSLKSSSVHI